MRRILLFGSLATGRATSRSDADILIILDEHPAPPVDRIPEYLDHFVKGPLPVDVFPLTQAEAVRRTERADAFLTRALNEGIDLL